jgi:hypothetical protein
MGDGIDGGTGGGGGEFDASIVDAIRLLHAHDNGQPAQELSGPLADFGDDLVVATEAANERRQRLSGTPLGKLVLGVEDTARRFEPRG